MEDNRDIDGLSVENYSDIIDSEVLATLLRDHTTGRNITWATRDYEHLGEGYLYGDEIKAPASPPALVPRAVIAQYWSREGAGRPAWLDFVKPRVMKSRDEQTQRSKEMAEVFSPSWLCNAQNNLVDEAWFGRKDVFNTEQTAEDGTHTWVPSQSPITLFPEGRTWRDYVRDTRLEITCGEAPYLVSRYDATTGETIPIHRRIGLLDRKLRIVSENTETSADWLAAAQEAFQSVYGYEWQGDNLLLARMNLLLSFIEYYQAKFGKTPLQKSVNYIAYIVSWNVWQMDGLKGVVPDSCVSVKVTTYDMFEGEQTAIHPCPGCERDDIHRHNGTYCLIRDWRAKKDKQKVKFVDLLHCKNSS